MGAVKDTIVAAVAGYVGTEAAERAGTKLMELEPEQDRQREQEVRAGPPFALAADHLATRVFGIDRATSSGRRSAWRSTTPPAAPGRPSANCSGVAPARDPLRQDSSRVRPVAHPRRGHHPGGRRLRGQPRLPTVDPPPWTRGTPRLRTRNRLRDRTRMEGGRRPRRSRTPDGPCRPQLPAPPPRRGEPRSRA